MPWYKFYANHGPGHQSHSEFFRWYEEKLDRQGREDYWTEMFGTGFDWPIGGVKLIDRLPENVHRELMVAAESDISSGMKMLGVLKTTGTKPVINTRLVTEIRNKKPVSFFRASLRKNPDMFRDGKTRECSVRNLLRRIKCKRSDFVVN